MLRWEAVRISVGAPRSCGGGTLQRSEKIRAPLSPASAAASRSDSEEDPRRRTWFFGFGTCAIPWSGFTAKSVCSSRLCRFKSNERQVENRTLGRQMVAAPAIAIKHNSNLRKSAPPTSVRPILEKSNRVWIKCNRTSQRVPPSPIPRWDSRHTANNRGRRSTPLRGIRAGACSARPLSSRYNGSHHST